MDYDYASELLGKQVSRPIKAKEAQSLAKKFHTPGLDINYALTIRRVYDIIRAAATRGDTVLVYNTPSYVMDGTVCDPIFLARQIKAKLSSKESGFKVSRNDNELTISWD